jgi:hypothetical protein
MYLIGIIDHRRNCPFIFGIHFAILASVATLHFFEKETAKNYKKSSNKKFGYFYYRNHCNTIQLPFLLA